MTKEGVDCDYCGHPDLFHSDEKGHVWDHWEQVCPSCFRRNTISADNEEASVMADADCIDIGQSRCDGSCGASRRWVAEYHPCDGRHCRSLKSEDRNRLKAAAEKFNAEHPLTPGDPEE